MSDLQISLLIIGAIVVAAVYLLNWRQERAFRRRTEQAFAQKHDDVLLGERTAEPLPAAERLEPRLEPVMRADPGPSAVPEHTDNALDSAIDYVVEVTLPAAHDGADLAEELSQLTAGWNKPLLITGYDETHASWRQAAKGARFNRLRVALQMANRAGCIAQSQLSAFREAVFKWAERMQADAAAGDVIEAHAMAVELDSFCADVDIAIGINVVTGNGTPFAGTKIRMLAETRGLKLEPDGVFYALDGAGSRLYTLDNHEPMPFVPEQMQSLTTSGVTFLLDVPRVSDPAAAFDAMLETARVFAAALNGTLVDDNRAALSEAALGRIRQQLRTILAKMEAAQMPAGGERAQRLFS